MYGFTYLWIPLNFADPAYLVHASSVFIFSLMVCEHNWPLWIGPHQLLNYSLYWFPRVIQYLSSIEQVKQFILSYGSVTCQGTIDLSSYLYNPSYIGSCILYLVPSTLYDHFTTPMIDIAPYGVWILIVATSGSKPSICAGSCISSSDNKQQVGWLPLGDNHFYKSWSSWPDIENRPPLGFLASTNS